MRTLKNFLFAEAGFVAAEKALLTLLGLAAAILVAKYILAGSTTAANTVKTGLESATLPSH